MSARQERTRWCVRVALEGGGYGVLSVGNPGRMSWLTKRIAEQHARDFKATYLRDAWVEED